MTQNFLNVIVRHQDTFSFQLTRDERLQILTLRSLNMKYEDIAKHLGVSIRHVQLACHVGHPAPSKGLVSR
jgi:DNA-directed RNA polymerase specialized sigma24 family protein